MLHDALAADRRPEGAQTERRSGGAQAEELVDSEAALEFMKEATKVATGTELEDVGERLEAKSRLFREILAEDRLAELDETGLKRLLGSIFSLRRKSKRLLRANDLETIRAELQALLYDEGPVAGRFDRFVNELGGLEKAMIVSLASEALHYTEPERYWLWTHWIWNPKSGTGALPLITQEADLAMSRSLPSGATATDGEVYDKVGRALVLVNAQGHAIGYSRSGRGLFGTDVFLACVYAVYMFTVFRVKLSQEFNRILPELPELVQRVLGVRAMEIAHV
ncbi:MAG: hypothetical protein GY769_10575 [bacterium]|nr:hypothetical protein [bacterium]